MHALVDINGKQYEVEEGRYIQVDSFAAKENDAVTLDNILMIVAGKDSLIGTPYIEKAKVTARVQRHGRGPKLTVFKMKPKKTYRRKKGHRQGFTELMIETIEFPGREKFGATQKPKKTEDKAPKKAKKEPAAETAVEEKPKKAKASTATEAPKTEKKQAKADKPQSAEGKTKKEPAAEAKKSAKSKAKTKAKAKAKAKKKDTE